uniref:Uncharacterized protein n=1 Tax=Melanopsichium pennsylvanicum 4 TaxID=1398559 RepID=A0A077REP7_9BASI|nr:uncharacterized protein BN887_06083 [Melanopsichium pennsylvanicum 4]
MTELVASEPHPNDHEAQFNMCYREFDMDMELDFYSSQASSSKLFLNDILRGQFTSDEGTAQPSFAH